jgi:hypothetical protein
MDISYNKYFKTVKNQKYYEVFLLILFNTMALNDILGKGPWHKLGKFIIFWKI